MTKRIGIFAGTFDPVHRGHIAFALAALKQCALDKVVFMPEHSPRGKMGVSDFVHRLQMLKLAVRPHRTLHALRLDETQFTVAETLPALQQKYAGAQLVMLFGSDVVRTFGFRWPGLETLLAQVELAISLRAGEAETELADFLTTLAVPIKATFVHGPHAHVSATKVRQGDLQGIEPIVRDYIVQQGLYQPQAV